MCGYFLRLSAEGILEFLLSLSHLSVLFFHLTLKEMKLVEKKNIAEIVQWMRTMLIRMHGKNSRIPYIQMEKFQLNLAFQWLQVCFDF